MRQKTDQVTLGRILLILSSVFRAPYLCPCNNDAKSGQGQCLVGGVRQFRLKPCPLKTLSTIALVTLLGTPASGQKQSSSVDLVLQYLSRPRYYVIIAVDRIRIAKADLPYALVDAKQLSTMLESAGFQPLSSSPPLTGEQANLDDVGTLLRDIRNLPDASMVIVYYSGHAWASETSRDLWLQLYDNRVLGDDGLSFASLINLVRGGGGGESWKGELAVIIDSCYSGKAAFAASVMLSDLVGDTAVLASSDREETSRSIAAPTGEMSAFTYALLLGAGKAFGNADEDRDGILTFREIENFASAQLIDWEKQRLIDGPMSPRLFENATTLILKYDPTKQYVPDSNTRKKIGRKLLQGAMRGIESILLAGDLKVHPRILGEVRELVDKLQPYLPNDLETRALGKLARGQTSEALTDLRKVIYSQEEHEDTHDEGMKLLLARLYAVAGFDTDAAIEYFLILQNGASHPRALIIEAASALARARQFDEAETLLLNTIVADGNRSSVLSTVAHNNLGVIYASQGQFSKAEESFRAALGLSNPDTSSHWLTATVNSNLADAYRLDNKLEQAEKQYAFTVDLQASYGTDPEQHLSDLEKYASVLSASKKTSLATKIKRLAESIAAALIPVRRRVYEQH